MKIIIILFIFLLKLYPVKADDIIDLNKKASLSITLKEENKIDGAEIQIIQIGNIDIINNNLTFSYVDELKECNYKITNENIENIAKCLENKNLEKVKKITKNGTVEFNNLNLGVYYIKQTNNVEGYTQISPFIITLPQEINNTWEYNIDASPKINILSLTDITIKKIWNIDNENKIPDSVTVELYQNNTKIKTIKLSKENNWQITIKNLPKSDNYSIKEINVPESFIPTYSSNNYTYTVTNTQGLPQTGQLTYISISFLFIGLIVILIGLIIKKYEK